MPRPNSHQRLKTQRTRMYHEQRGLCFYCTTKTVLPEEMEPDVRAKRPPKNMATLEHLDDKFSGLRGTFRGEVRHVMACLKCNLRRCKESIEQNIEEHLRRVRNGHQKKLPKSLPDANPVPISVSNRAETI